MCAGWSYDAIKETRSNKQASEFDASQSRLTWSDTFVQEPKSEGHI
jgi:hypothetical protein